MDAATVTTKRRLPAGRKAELAAYVAESGQVTVVDLASHFGVSIDTVRRDLDQLDREGIVVRTHGGAVSAMSVPGRDRGLDVRLQMQISEKERIAALAVDLVEDGSVLMLNAGTTTLAVARALRNHRNLTIATNNLRIPAEISPSVFRDLFIFGGAVRTITQATTGPVTLAMSSNTTEVDIRCDYALIAVGAVDASGYSTSNLGDADDDERDDPTRRSHRHPRRLQQTRPPAVRAGRAAREGRLPRHGRSAVTRPRGRPGGGGG